MTIITKIKALGGILAILLLCGWALYTVHMKSDRDRWMLEASVQREAAAAMARDNESMVQELEANRRALKQRDAEKERLANENAALVAAINEVYANDPDAKDWADTLCPDGVLDCLLK